MLVGEKMGICLHAHGASVPLLDFVAKTCFEGVDKDLLEHLAEYKGLAKGGYCAAGRCSTAAIGSLYGARTGRGGGTDKL